MALPRTKTNASVAVDDGGQQVSMVSDTVVYKRYAAVLDRTVRYPNGKDVSFDIWTKNWRNQNEFCLCVPFDSSTGTVTMIREYFPAHHRFLWSFPGGNVEEKHGSPLKAIQAELEEEAHLVGGRWTSLLDPGCAIPQDKYQEDSVHMFLVVDPEPTPNPACADDEELIIVEQGISIEKLWRLIFSAQLPSNGTAVALLALDRLQKDGFNVAYARGAN